VYKTEEKKGLIQGANTLDCGYKSDGMVTFWKSYHVPLKCLISKGTVHGMVV